MPKYGIDKAYYKRRGDPSGFLGIADAKALVRPKGDDEDQSYVSYVCKLITVGGPGSGRSNVHMRKREFYNKAEAYYEQRASKRGYRDVNVLHFYDTAVINVGVVDGSILHTSPFGEIIEYSDLFNFLFLAGYDPLLPIRKGKVSQKVVAKIERVFKKLALAGKTKTDIENSLSPIGRELQDYVVEYIAGGNKPQLDKDTITTRRWREKAGLAPYPKGIKEPLVESGQLQEAISFNIEVYESSEMREAIKKHAEIDTKLARHKKKHSGRTLAIDNRMQEIQDDWDAKVYAAEVRARQARAKQLEEERRWREEQDRKFVVPGGIFKDIVLFRKELARNIDEDMAMELYSRWMAYKRGREMYGSSSLSSSKAGPSKNELAVLDIAITFLKSKGHLIEE